MIFFFPLQNGGMLRWLKWCSKRLHGTGTGGEDKIHLSGILMISTWNGCGWNSEAQTVAVEIKADILALTEMRD